MNILVVGGAGYIGKALVNSLIDAGHRVRVLDRKPVPMTQVQAGCEYMRGDLLDAVGLANALDEIEAVYHLAWSFYPGDNRREVEENLRGTLNLIEACEALRVRQIIFASSAVVYGPTGKEPACEADACHPERSTIGGPVYAITKLACEYYFLASQREGPAVTVLRIHGVFSQDRLAQFARMIGQAKEGKDIVAVSGAGGQYAHLDDVVWAMRRVLGRDEALGEVFNVAGCRDYLDSEMANYIVAVAGTGSKVVLLNDPSQAMVSVSIDKLSRTTAYRPRESDFLRDFIASLFS